MKRILGIDYGEVRTGIAVSDLLGSMASGVATVKPENHKELIEIIARYAEEYDVEKIVIGNPINMNGTVGTKSEIIARLSERLAERTGKEVILFDERCTTMLAHKILNETDTRGKKRKNLVDTLSAEIILQNYLDRVHSVGGR